MFAWLGSVSLGFLLGTSWQTVTLFRCCGSSTQKCISRMKMFFILRHFWIGSEPSDMSVPFRSPFEFGRTLDWEEKKDGICGDSEVCLHVSMGKCKYRSRFAPILEGRRCFREGEKGRESVGYTKGEEGGRGERGES